MARASVRSCLALSAALLAPAALSSSFAACTGGEGEGEGKTACNTAIDCDLDEACRGGFCVPNEPVDGGDANVDAGTSHDDETSAAAAICQRVSSCQSDPTQTQACIDQTLEQFRQMHAQNTDICEKVAADLVEFYTCAGGATCDELNDATRLAARCPIFDEVQNEFDQCQGGEGEGEGEPPPDECFVAPEFDPNGTTDEIILLDVVGTVDVDANPLCETEASATLRVEFDGDPDVAASLIGESIASFDQRSVFDTLPLDFSEPGVLRAVACGDDASAGFVAFQLLLVDGTHSNAVCGSLSFP